MLIATRSAQAAQQLPLQKVFESAITQYMHFWSRNMLQTSADIYCHLLNK